MIMNNCPEGDVTGDDIAACTVWEGVIYSIGADGKVGSLPEEGIGSGGATAAAGFRPGRPQFVHLGQGDRRALGCSDLQGMRANDDQ